MNKKLTGLLAMGLLALAGCEGDDGSVGPAGATGAAGPAGPAGVPLVVTRTDVVTTNANIAYASYSDSWVLAIGLQGKIDDLVAAPWQKTFVAAKDAWRAVNEPYGQTGFDRCRVGPVGARLTGGSLGVEGDGPEGAIDAWPLGEALVDYVATAVDGDEGSDSGNPPTGVTGNIISDTTFTLSKANIRDNNELDDDERSLATGFHVIEFLLWGQDRCLGQQCQQNSQ